MKKKKQLEDNIIKDVRNLNQALKEKKKKNKKKEKKKKKKQKQNKGKLFRDMRTLFRSKERRKLLPTSKCW